MLEMARLTLLETSLFHCVAPKLLEPQHRDTNVTRCSGKPLLKKDCLAEEFHLHGGTLSLAAQQGPCCGMDESLLRPEQGVSFVTTRPVQQL